MATSMHRLQISLPREQVRFLRDQAKSEGVSIAEVIRRLVRRESDERRRRKPTKADYDSIWSICGIIDEPEDLIDGIPVSENVDLYLYGPREKELQTKKKRRKLG